MHSCAIINFKFQTQSFNIYWPEHYTTDSVTEELIIARRNLFLWISLTLIGRKKKFPGFRVLTLLSLLLFGEQGMAQRWERSPPTNVARVQIPASTPYVGWVCCWFSPLLREVFLRVLRFSPLLKNQHFQIPIRPGIR